jgi:hypothetical protein
MVTKMKRTTWIFGFLLLLVGLFLGLARPAQAGPSIQVAYQTPTALPDGRVIYKVQSGDSCLRIELVTGVKVEQLRTLNKLDEACSIQPDQELILAVIVPTPTATVDLGVTATPLLPTPTPKKGSGEICVVLFADVNGNAAREETEGTILGGAVSVTDRGGTVSQTGITLSGTDLLCFKDIPEGDYNVALAVPDGYNPTTTTNYPLQLVAGNRSVIDFGAQASSRPVAPETAAPSSGGRSPLLLVLGGILILGGIGLAVYFRVLKR